MTATINPVEVGGLSFQQMEGPRGVSLQEAAHMYVPGRGRSADGMALSETSAERVVYGADFYLHAGLTGQFVMSGYKTPAEKLGEIWTPPGSTEEFIGVPEADSMDRTIDTLEEEYMMAFGRTIPKSKRRIERHSIDTVTNFARAEAEHHFGEGDERPTIIVGQEEHLARMFERRGVARRTLRRDYVGLVVPELAHHVDKDPRQARIASMLILGTAHTGRSRERVLRNTTKNANRVWGGVLAIQSLRRGNELTYNTDTN